MLAVPALVAVAALLLVAATAFASYQLVYANNEFFTLGEIAADGGFSNNDRNESRQGAGHNGYNEIWLQYTNGGRNGVRTGNGSLYYNTPQGQYLYTRGFC